jgi:hypothetical protein
MRRNREFEVFSLSFLDCICCGFGAIILLIVVSDFRRPATLEASRQSLAGQVLALTRQLELIRGDSDTLARELRGQLADLERAQRRATRLAGDLTRTHGQYTASREEGSVTNTLESQLVVRQRAREAQFAQLLARQREQPGLHAVGGIPVDAEYVVFLIDTSSSMTDNHWEAATQVLKEILDIYPQLQGVQVLSDRARPMFPGTQGKWLDDSAALRTQIVAHMKGWRVESESNPVDGIRDAIRTYAAPGRRVSLYVLGDEFTGDSIQQSLNEIGAANKPQADGRRPVRIHAVGFPEAPGFPVFTSVRFSALMRLVCEQSGGTFVGLLQ